MDFPIDVSDHAKDQWANRFPMVGDSLDDCLARSVVVSAKSVRNAARTKFRKSDPRCRACDAEQPNGEVGQYRYDERTRAVFCLVRNANRHWWVVATVFKSKIATSKPKTYS